MTATAEARPDVSVVIPTRDRRKMLLRAIHSCVTQGASVAVEVIVVDDGCKDGSVEAVGEHYPEVFILTDRHGGNRNLARNDGLDRASGRFVKFLDDDDWLEHGALVEEVRLADQEGADIVVGGHRIAGSDSPEVERMPPAFDRGVDSLLAGEAVPTAAALYRREWIATLRWDPRWHKLDDWRFFLQASMKARRIARLERVVYTWHAHPGQGTRRDTLLDNAMAFYDILDEVESGLRSEDQLTAARSERLAQYRYKELRVLCVYARERFEAEVLRIRALDPHFRPLDEERQRWMRWFSRFVGFRRAILFHTYLKKLVKGSFEVPG